MGTSEYVFTPLEFRNRQKYHSILYLHDLVEPAQIAPEHHRAFEEVRPLGALSDDEIVRIMLADDLDLLIVLDCVGHGGKDHVIARRPARRILYYGNVFVPSDLASVDGLIAPATMASCFAKVDGEKAVISIPDWVNLVANLNGRFLEPLPESGDEVPTLGSIATGYKLNSAWFQMAARVLTRVPEARLRLDVPTVHDSGLRRLHGLAHAAGIDSRRISINFATYGEDFASRLSTISLALDSFPVGSYFSAIQALSAGVPLLTFLGKTPLGLGAATVMNAAGLQDLICADPGAMEERAVALLRAPELLRDLRCGLPQAVRASGLGDFPATAGAWEIALDRGLALPVRQIG
jgi:protein O-GlcNAc transferase